MNYEDRHQYPTQEEIHSAAVSDLVLLSEHAAGEHFDDVILDCPPCAKEWAEITGKPEGVA